jgi:tape measure domain-containing protein
VELSSLTVKLDTTPVQTAKNRLDGMMKSATAAERALLGLENRTRSLYQATSTLLDALGRANSGFKKYGEFASGAARGMKDMNSASEVTSRRLGSVATFADKAATAVARYKASLAGAGVPGIPGVLGNAGGGAGGPGGAFRARFGGIANFGPVSGGMLTSLPAGAAAPVAAGVVGAAMFLASAKAAAELVQKTVEVSMAFEKVKNTLGVGVGFDKVGEEMAYVRGLSDKLGMNLLSTAQGYAQMTAASKGTRLEGEATRRVFEGLSKASTALQWSQQDMSLALLAVTQMISKGKVSSEELRRQLGERMPGAMRMAADAMGITTRELEKQLKAGKLMTDDFLPKFAEQLEKKFGPAAEQAANSLQANFNRMETAVQTFFMTLGELGISEGFKLAMKGVAQAVKSVTESVEAFAKTAGGQALAASIRTLGAEVGNLVVNLTAMLKSTSAIPGVVDVLTYSMLGFSAVLAGIPPFLKAVNAGLSAFSSFQLGLGKLATGDLVGASEAFAVGRVQMTNYSKAAEDMGGAVDGVFKRFVNLRQEIQNQQKLDAFGPFIKDQPKGPQGVEEPAEAGKKSQLARYIEQLDQKIAALKGGTEAARELRIEQLKGTEAERGLALARSEELKTLELEAFQAKEAKAEQEALRNTQERLAAEFMKTVDRQENGVRKLNEMQEIGQMLMASGVITAEEYARAMEGLNMKYNEGPGALQPAGGGRGEACP